MSTEQTIAAINAEIQRQEQELKKLREALAQLRHRLAAADAAAKARELELLAVIEDLERLIPQINRGGTP